MEVNSYRIFSVLGFVSQIFVPSTADNQWENKGQVNINDTVMHHCILRVYPDNPHTLTGDKAKQFAAKKQEQKNCNHKQLKTCMGDEGKIPSIYRHSKHRYMFCNRTRHRVAVGLLSIISNENHLQTLGMY